MRRKTLDILEDPELTDWQYAMLFQNVERTRLSNERNFLNWVRASLAFITLGFIVYRLEILAVGSLGSTADAPSPAMAFWVPMIFFGLGGALVALGTVEFFRVRKEINAGCWIGTTLIRDLLIIMLLVSLLAVVGVFLLARP